MVAVHCYCYLTLVTYHIWLLYRQFNYASIYTIAAMMLFVVLKIYAINQHETSQTNIE